MTPTSTTGQPTDAASRHTPVLLQRCLDLLAPAFDVEHGPCMVDSTLGMGGHTEGVLRAFPHVRVVGLDRDTQALELAGRRLAPFGDRFTGVHAVYDEINDVLDRLGIRGRPGRAHGPRRLVAAARRARARLLLLGRTRRSTCAWTPRPARPRRTC